MATALEVFAELGYEGATVDDLAARAGLSRSTWFRRFGSKEAVVFSDHELLLARLDARLRASTDAPFEAVRDAALEVFRHHVELGATAKRRFRLLRSVPALRDREVVTARSYESLFVHHLTERGVDRDRAIGGAAAIVAVHNAALRDWLEGDEQAARGLPGRLAAVAARFMDPAVPDGGALHVVVIGEPGVERAGLEERIRASLAPR